MPVPTNPFKQALQEGRRQIGLWQSMASAYTAEICAGAGFDWLLFDGEHAPNDVPSMLAQLQAVESYPTHAIARPPVGDVVLVKQYLDLGFQTLLIPLVDTAEQAAHMVRAMRYPPDGIRGVGAGSARVARWNRVDNYFRDADEQMCLLVQAETRLAMENLDAVAATDGVDGVFIGPADLSAALGHRGNAAHPEVQAVIEDAFARIIKAGKAAGILTSNEEWARRYLDLGATFVAVGTDVGILAKQTLALAGRFKGDSGA
ncbi:MAG TPA: 4-hydroxy-2-oxoheptanedioate aldolase [Caulobacteraceae bacterium]